MQAKKILNSHEFQLNVCFKKTWTNCNTVSLLWFVQVFLKQTLVQMINTSKVFKIGNMHYAVSKENTCLKISELNHHVGLFSKLNCT